MKKIVFAMPQLFGGGAERVVAALAEEISRRGQYEVHVLTYIQDPEKDYSLSRNVVRHTWSGESRSIVQRIISKIRFLRGTILRIQPDCVISLAGPAMVTLLVLALTGTDMPLILSERNDPRQYPSGQLLRLLRNWAYVQSTAVVFQTREAKSFFSPSVQGKGTVIPNPLTACLPQPYEGIREKRIVSSCRLTPQKNLDLLIDAFSDISGNNPRYTLDIYGEGSEKERLQTKIRNLGLEDKVTLRGYSYNIHDDILKASVFVLSSNYEGISNAMLEAIALGIPTICTDCPAGGARETILHGKNGILVPVGGRQELAEAMQKLISEPEYAEKLGREGVKLRDQISTSVIADVWLSVMEEALESTNKNHGVKYEH